MKKTVYFITCALAVCLALISFSCETVKEIVGTPSLSLKAVGIQSLDLEGITFSCDYAIENPYPVSFSVKRVAADVLHDGSVFTRLETSGGVSVAARGSRTNTMLFKVPYESILGFAKKSSGKTSLPFTLKGSASLDLSSVPLFEGQSLDIPFSRDFDVPVFKPELSVSDVKLELPTLGALQDAFTGSGMSAIKAASLAASILSGKQLNDDVFAGVNLNMKVTCNVNVANKGSAPWKYLLENCSLKSASGTLVQVQPKGSAAITSASGTVPVEATLNTLQAGSFIVQLLNKKGANPVFTLDSGLTFTGLAYSPDIPLSYTKELPLSSIGVTKK